jgi:hypothetical protein
LKDVSSQSGFTTPPSGGDDDTIEAAFEVHRSKISLHGAKVGYGYPTIQLPHTFSKLAGLSARIYQTVHNGACISRCCLVGFRSQQSKQMRKLVFK